MSATPLLTNILRWATASLTPWQRDALRRLFQKQELIQQDFDDLYAMLKSARELPDPKNRQPVPLAQEHLPAQGASASTVILRAMRGLKNVNRIAPGQALEFAPKGLTVIYGGNASGKSGYSRVLKRACRARDLSETVHPDARDPKASSRIPEATFDIDVGGRMESVAWKRDEQPPEKLSTIAVFDTRCARAYLDTEQEVAYIPYGLDIVENLGQRVLPQLSKMLETDISAVDTDTAPFADLLGETGVGKLVSSLSADTDPERVKSLATLTTTEKTRLSTLDSTLAESNPTAKARLIQLSAQRIDALISRIDTAVSRVSDEAVERLKAFDTEAETASKAEAAAAEKFRSGESLLPGTGDQVWKMLFEAARRFSTAAAYPEKPFPNIESGTQCVLCQQTLDPTAAERMQRFDAFVKEDTAKVAAEKRTQLEKEIRVVAGAVLTFGLDKALAEELAEFDAVLLQSTQDFEREIEARRTWMLDDGVKKHDWSAPPKLEHDPRASLQALSKSLAGQAEELLKAGKEEKRKELEAERTELRVRTNLSPRLKAVLELIERMKLKQKLASCKPDLRTKRISDKAKEFADQAVTASLKGALDAEFRELGVGHIQTKLNQRVVQARMMHKLVLDLPVTAKLDEILSEGEQRAIAIGSFLAELHLAGHKGGIVFDDPVSSLDHHWRRNVAQRLVKEAKTRQVIIFTHDTAFLGDLRDEIEQQNGTSLMCHLEWTGENPGKVSAGLPWEHKSYGERLDTLEKAQRALEKVWNPYPDQVLRDKIRHQYDFLRATIERVIQDVVFNGVVQRYRDWVKVDKLEGAVGFAEGEYKEIARLHKACCQVVDAHDPPSAKNPSVPDPARLKKDIEDLKAVVDTIRSRRKSPSPVGTTAASTSS